MDELRTRQRGWRLVAKRALDGSVAAVGLALSAPVLIVAAAAIRVTMGPPVLFHQQRPGLFCKSFNLLKFRTMTDACDAQGHLVPDDDRLTAVGRFLRSTSIDELPQLWNVLRGDMSLVGPRPLLVEYLERYTTEQSRRHAVLPGITGWAQIRGRNALRWEEKFTLDVWYVDNWSLFLDLRILAATAATVFQRKGVSAPGHATMPEFLGTRN